MSLYYDAAPFLTSDSHQSLKIRVYGVRDLKSKTSHVYALCSEATKWSHVLSKIIEQSEILSIEKKLTPSLTLLLVHDFLLSKHGIAAPKGHPLRVAVERHKARLQAEFSRARIKAGFPSVDKWRSAIDLSTDLLPKPYPRWVRINTLLTSLDHELEKGFLKSWKRSSDLAAVTDPQRSEGPYFIEDETIPHLVACTPQVDLTKTLAYKRGQIILQDKASCFPAYLLDPVPTDGDIIDACAAPGNKTTHLAALLQKSDISRTPQSYVHSAQQIFAIERDRNRGITLGKMVKSAGAGHNDLVHSIVGQDFLKVNPNDKKWNRVGALLLDPSCSGSGIIGRDDEEQEFLQGDLLPQMCLPSASSGTLSENRTSKKSRKRKRIEPNEDSALPRDQDRVPHDNLSKTSEFRSLPERLEALSTFQVSALEHAFKFPALQKVVYSTCSIHVEENEFVVLRALDSFTARQRGWRVMRREEQVPGMQAWHLRGNKEALSHFSSMFTNTHPSEFGSQQNSTTDIHQISEACIRCKKGTNDGTMGFFTVGFKRDISPIQDEFNLKMGCSSGSIEVERRKVSSGDEDEWEGFEDFETIKS